MSIDAKEIDSLIDSNPSMVLHITRKLAIDLKGAITFIEAQNVFRAPMNNLLSRRVHVELKWSGFGPSWRMSI